MSEALPQWLLDEIADGEAEYSRWLAALGFPNLKVKFDITPLDVYVESPGHNDDKNDIGVII